MRRSIALFLVSLALLVRLLAPGIAEARLAFDPLTDAPICAHDGITAPNGEGDGPLKHAHCELSCCHVASGFVPPVVVSPVLLRASVPVPWCIPGTAFLRHHAPQTPRARGPPVVS